MRVTSYNDQSNKFLLISLDNSMECDMYPFVLHETIMRRTYLERLWQSKSTVQRTVWLYRPDKHVVPPEPNEGDQQAPEEAEEKSDGADEDEQSVELEEEDDDDGDQEEQDNVSKEVEAAVQEEEAPDNDEEAAIASRTKSKSIVNVFGGAAATNQLQWDNGEGSGGAFKELGEEFGGGSAMVQRLMVDNTILHQGLIPLMNVQPGKNSRSIQTRVIQNIADSLLNNGWKPGSHLIVTLDNPNGADLAIYDEFEGGCMFERSFVCTPQNEVQ
jgi:hypothetical protein